MLLLNASSSQSNVLKLLKEAKETKSHNFMGNFGDKNLWWADVLFSSFKYIRNLRSVWIAPSSIKEDIPDGQ